METPKYIYVTTFGLNPLHHPWGCWTTRECDGIKYIRADLAELTWEDIRVICEIESDLWEEVCQGEKEDSMQPYYTEVLRRFLESKKEVEL